MADDILTFRDETTGICSLMKAVPKHDPDASGTVILDLELVALVDTERAEAIEGVVPAATAQLRRAVDEGWSTTVTVRPPAAGASLTFRTQDDEEHILKGEAEIRQLTFKVTKKAQVFTAKVRMLAVQTATIGRILSVLGDRVLVDVVPKQLGMDFDGPPQNSLAVGQRLVDGCTVCGIVVNRGEDDRVIIDDFGVMHVVQGSESWVHLADGWREHANTYKKGVEAFGGIPTWGDILPALGQMLSANDGDLWELDAAVVDRAVNNARAAS